MRSRAGVALLLALAGGLPAADIAVTRRMALVIGNAHYRDTPLRNPLNDAQAVGETLRGLHFDVTSGVDLNRRQMEDTVAQFAGQLRAGDLAVFYYSGHGLQVGQENYLLPIDFQAMTNVEAISRSIAAGAIRDRLERSGARLRVLILDACRENPFGELRGGGRGLAPMSSLSEGTLVAYATSDNSTAEDLVGESNSLYTKYLVEALRTPGMSLKEVFEQTRVVVWIQSGRRQRPFTYDGVNGDLLLTGKGH